MDIKKGEWQMLMERLEAIEQQAKEHTEKASACQTAIVDVHRTALEMKEKLWGKNGFEGDVVEIKASVTEAKVERKEMRDEFVSCADDIRDFNRKLNGRIKVIEDWKKLINRAIIACIGSGAIGGSIAGIIKGVF